MTNYLLSSFLTVTDELLNEATVEELALAGRYRQIRAAVSAYSHDRPDIYVEDESGDGGKYYVMVGGSALLAQWVDGFSHVLSIEYPAATVASDEAPTYLEVDDYDDDYWVDVSGTQTRYLYFKNASPAATDTWRIAYTIPYKWTASSTTVAVPQTAHGLSVDDYTYYNGSEYVEAVNPDLASHRVTAVADVDNFTAAILQTTTPDGDFDAICYKSACLICRAIAAKYSRIGDTLVGVDSAAHTTKATEFSNRAREFCDMYNNLLGLAAAGDGAVRDAAAGEFVDLDTTPTWRRGRGYLFH